MTTSRATESQNYNSSVENGEEDAYLYEVDDSDHEHSVFVQTADDLQQFKKKKTAPSV